MRAGGSSLHSTGSSPGFITEALPLVLTSLQRRLDHLLIEEFADMSSRNSPELIFDLMGFGRDPATFDPRGVEAHGGASFAGSLEVLADALSLPLDAVEATGQVATARHDVDVAAGHVQAGTIGAQRMQVSGMRDGRPLVTFSANWYLTTDVEPAWDLRETGWHVLVEGDTPLDVDIRFPVPGRRVGGDVARLDGAPARQRHPLRLRGGTRASGRIVDLPQVVATLWADGSLR